MKRTLPETMVSGHIWDDHARRGQTMFVSSEAPRSIEHKKEPVTRSPFFSSVSPKKITIHSSTKIIVIIDQKVPTPRLGSEMDSMNESQVTEVPSGVIAMA